MEAGLQLALESAPFLLKGAYYTVILSLGGMFFDRRERPTSP